MSKNRMKIKYKVHYNSFIPYNHNTIHRKLALFYLKESYQV